MVTIEDSDFILDEDLHPRMKKDTSPEWNVVLRKFTYFKFRLAVSIYCHQGFVLMTTAMK